MLKRVAGTPKYYACAFDFSLHLKVMLEIQMHAKNKKINGIIAQSSALSVEIFSI